MPIPGADQAIGHLIKWSEKDEWAPYRRQVFAEHFELIMERFDISEQEIVDLLDEAFDMVCGFVLEDFFTARFGEEGELNVVDDYLKRRGWREKVPAKRYLEALRDSVATLYEVVDLDPGHGMTVRDVVLGGDPVSVEEKLGSQSAARWDRIAGRIVTVDLTLKIGGVAPSWIFLRHLGAPCARLSELRSACFIGEGEIVDISHQFSSLLQIIPSFMTNFRFFSGSSMMRRSVSVELNAMAGTASANAAATRITLMGHSLQRIRDARIQQSPSPSC
jgi:hypothetical protein